MKVEKDKFGDISKLKEVYRNIEFESNDGEKLTVVMRDSGFELTYEGQRIDLKEGKVVEYSKKLRGTTNPSEDIPTTNG
jgi:hypothetical protein